MKTNLLLSVACLVIFVGQSYGQAPKAAINYLALPGPFTVQNQVYRLAWSSHPDASLYKHEYLAAGDQFPNYKSLITVDFVVTPSTVGQAVSTKIRQLEAMKKTNPIVNYELMENKTMGEVIIDCIIGETAADDRNSVVERDVFRYKSVSATSGQRGILLFAVSIRKYGSDITSFLTKLKADKKMLVNEVAKLPMPAINLAK